MIAKAIENSQNKKTGPCSATYASQGSCPNDCVFRGQGCYAETGLVNIQTIALKEGLESSPEDIAIQEAESISQLTGRNDLRVHVVGDCKTAESANILADAMRKHRKKRGRAAWTYTHAWKNVNGKEWRGESVLASVETVGEIIEARAQGYASAIVVKKFARDKVYMIDGQKVVPCLFQTKGTQCIDCRLCMNTEALQRTNTSIAFEVHGASKKKVLVQLEIKNKR
jgi:hypothetical protein